MGDKQSRKWQLTINNPIVGQSIWDLANEVVNRHKKTSTTAQ